VMWRALLVVIRKFWSELTAARRTRKSVRGQLMRVVAWTTASALLFAGSAMLWHDLVVYRETWSADLVTQASILALSTAPALAFDDHATAERNLLALQARPRIQAGALYLPDGSVYAQFARPGARPPPATVGQVTDKPLISGERVELTQRIMRNGEWLGTIYVRANYDMRSRVVAYLSVFSLVTAASMLAALILSTALRRVITAPLDAIARVAHQIVHQRDYSLRVQISSENEIGLVVDAFNSMLSEVQSRTQALEQSNAALQNADRRKDEFLATLAHELRNPLAPIRSAAKLLESPAADDRQRQWGRDVIARQVHRMALLLDDLLDVSRITSGRLQLRKQPLELASLITSAVETARPLIDAKQHHLEVLVPSEAIQLFVDPLRLSQALSNLLTNAAKYTDPSGRIILAAAFEGEDLTLSVRDSGIGLSTQALPRVFDMFSQVDSVVDRTEGGLGIGLALVKGLTELHGGTVQASSEGPGCGSTFTIRLPRASVMAPVTQAEAVAATLKDTSGTRCRVLVADDNVDAAQTLTLILQMSGYNVFVANAGREALELALRERPEALILDIGMPQLTGYEVASRVRQESWGAHALLIAVTGWGQPSDKDNAKAAGFDHHLTKPVDLDEIHRLLATYSNRMQTR
jgi:signal transduction histidine kinase/ActR/RegA family two-component response regulator